MSNSFVRFASATVISFLLIFITCISGFQSIQDETQYPAFKRQGNNNTIGPVQQLILVVHQFVIPDQK
jgi:hypothetical protein